MSALKRCNGLAGGRRPRAGLEVVCLGVFTFALRSGHDSGAARFLAFVALTAGNLMPALVIASQQAATGHRVARPFLWIALAAAAALALCAVLPALRALIGFGWAGWGALLATLAMGALSALPWELVKRWAPLARALGLRPRTLEQAGETRATG